MLTTQELVAGLNLYIFRSGSAATVPAGTASRTFKPGADPAWIDLGPVKDGVVEHSADLVTIRRPMPGKMRRWKNKRINHDILIKATLQEISPMSLELMLGTGALTGATETANPLDGEEFEAWVKCQVAGDDDEDIFVMDVFCELWITGGQKADGTLYEPTLECSVLHSNLNVIDI